MYTASLDIDRCWITLASDPSGPAVVCGTRQSSPADAVLDGELRHYAGNRVRAAVRDQDDLTLPLTLVWLSSMDKDQIVSWRGQPVLVRTMEGERFYAVYFSAPYHRALHTSTGTSFNIDVSFQRVTFDESV
jgi:hypothetical protein